MEFIIALLILAVSFCAVFLLLREQKNSLFFLRATVLVFSLTSILMFNINWLLNLAIKDGTWIFLFGIIFLAAFFMVGRERILQIKKVFTLNRKTNLFAGAIFCMAFILAGFYFQWNFVEPRYSTPDSGTHFLYMNATAKNGIMAMFGRNLIEDASGDESVAPKHNETYFPGATGVFAFLETILKPKNPAMMLQFFNTLCYAILSTYFILLLYSYGAIRNMKLLISFSVIILFGTFFNFVATSHSTQLLGLIFLIGFVDLFETYLQKKESWLPSALLFGAMVMTYFYWLPVALAFVGIRFLSLKLNVKNFLREFWKTSLPLAVGFIFCLGYILIMFRLNMFQYSSADGGVAFQDYLLSDALWIAPFALWQLSLLFWGWKTETEGRKFITSFFGAAGLFAFVLAVFYKNGFLVSHYTAMKVLYLIVPLAWALAFMFLQDNLSEIESFLKEANKKRKIEINKIRKKVAIGLLVLFIFSVGIAKAFEVDFEIFALLRKNLQLAFANKTEAAITTEQMKLLDRVKEGHADLLQDGQLVIIGTKSSLWAFGYSGIWPKTKSLIPESGNGKGAASLLNFSNDVTPTAYGAWLNQDKKHALVFFDTPQGQNVLNSIMLDLNDYEKIESIGNGYLLKLKKEAQPIYVDDWPIVSKEVEKVSAPIRATFVSKENVLAGIALKLQISSKKNVKEAEEIKLFSGKCEEESREQIAKAVIAKDDLLQKGEKRTMRAFFDNEVKQAKNKAWCLEVGAKGDDFKINRFKDGNFEMQPMYKYEQLTN